MTEFCFLVHHSAALWSYHNLRGSLLNPLKNKSATTQDVVSIQAFYKVILLSFNCSWPGSLSTNLDGLPLRNSKLPPLEDGLGILG